ncbi:MAG: Gfo/Idh/MocA family protein [Candidatus Fimenecus sp.]
MNKFRFAIMGAANIANKFCCAVNLLENCEVVAVSSKSMERAQAFADKNDLHAAYDDYEEMLIKEKPDCVYIAVTVNDHFRLCMLCMDYNVPVICEKAMFMNGREAEIVFKRSKEQRIFVMEATWSRYLPAIRQAKAWIEEGMIGEVRFLEASIGFVAPASDDNRYYNPALGGGAARDITIYAYELARMMVDKPFGEMKIQTVWGKTGVDLTEQILIRCEDILVSLITSFMIKLDETMVIYGDNGKIVIPKPHMASQAILYDEKDNTVEHFKDEQTQNGFVYEIRDCIECIHRGEIESKVVPHTLTLDCARLFDMITLPDKTKSKP